jgi:hypothetical protein
MKSSRDAVTESLFQLPLVPQGRAEFSPARTAEWFRDPEETGSRIRSFAASRSKPPPRPRRHYLLLKAMNHLD